MSSMFLGLIVGCDIFILFAHTHCEVIYYINRKKDHRLINTFIPKSNLNEIIYPLLSISSKYMFLTVIDVLRQSRMVHVLEFLKRN